MTDQQRSTRTGWVLPSYDERERWRQEAWEDVINGAHHPGQGKESYQSRTLRLIDQVAHLNERVAILEQELVEADNERRSQENAARANRKIVEREQGNIKVAFDYLRKIHALSREVDEIFALSEMDFPGQTE
jgi:glutathione S-transferase